MDGFKQKFSDKDSENLVRFLNFVADKAKFELKVKEVIEFYKLLAWAQTELKQKLEANIMGEYKLHEPEPKPAKPKAKAKAKPKAK